MRSRSEQGLENHVTGLKSPHRVTTLLKMPLSHSSPTTLLMLALATNVETKTVIPSGHRIALLSTCEDRVGSCSA